MAVAIGKGSFRGFEGQSGTSGGGSGPQAIADSNLSPDIRISNNLQTLSHNVKQLQKMTDSIGTNMDSKELRRNVRALQDKTNSLTKDISSAIKAYSNAAGETKEETDKIKIQGKRLRETFHDVLKTYNDLQKDIRLKMRDSLRSSLMKSGFYNLELEEDGTTHVIQDGQELELAQIQADVDLTLVKEREEQLKQLEQDIRDINSIFKDLAGMVQEQGEALAQAEENVDIAGIHIEEGKKDLAIAEDLTNSRRKKKLAIIVIVVIVVIVIVAIILAVTL